MKVYVTADMEGITGLVDAKDIQSAGRDYERGRVMMTGDVNAAVRGAFAREMGRQRRDRRGQERPAPVRRRARPGGICPGDDRVRC